MTHITEVAWCSSWPKWKVSVAASSLSPSETEKAQAAQSLRRRPWNQQEGKEALGAVSDGAGGLVPCVKSPRVWAHGQSWCCRAAGHHLPTSSSEAWAWNNREWPGSCWAEPYQEARGRGRHTKFQEQHRALLVPPNSFLSSSYRSPPPSPPTPFPLSNPVLTAPSTPT
jgi:hypothetical protein